jgi:small subunit ribosomal protein S17
MGRSITGIVTSDKSDKTIVITVVTRKTHKLYKKQYSVRSKFMAHDEKNDAKVGDKVVIVETRPISARKRFNLDKVVERAGVRFEETDATADVPVEPKPEPPAKPEPKPKKADKAAKPEAETVEAK